MLGTIVPMTNGKPQQLLRGLVELGEVGRVGEKTLHQGLLGGRRLHRHWRCMLRNFALNALDDGEGLRLCRLCFLHVDAGNAELFLQGSKMLHGASFRLGGEAGLPESFCQPLCCWLLGFQCHANGSHTHLEGADGVLRHVHGLHLL
eukprot:6475442-Amphidinium_carterae.1